MGVSTNAIIVYGISFDEDQEFPWTEHDDIETWWRDVQCGYKPPVELYDEEGNYLNGVKPTDEQTTAYYSHRREFEAAHPLPVEVVSHCSGDCPMTILSLPGLETTARRGYPEEINPATLHVTDEQKAALVKFCDDYGIEMPDEPKWYLCSM